MVRKSHRPDTSCCAVKLTPRANFSKIGNASTRDILLRVQLRIGHTTHKPRSVRAVIEVLFDRVAKWSANHHGPDCICRDRQNFRCRPTDHLPPDWVASPAPKLEQEPIQQRRTGDLTVRDAGPANCRFRSGTDARPPATLQTSAATRYRDRPIASLK